jgi:hypothetical protein
MFLKRQFFIIFITFVFSSIYISDDGEYTLKNFKLGKNITTFYFPTREFQQQSKIQDFGLSWCGFMPLRVRNGRATLREAAFWSHILPRQLLSRSRLEINRAGRGACLKFSALFLAEQIFCAGHISLRPGGIANCSARILALSFSIFTSYCVLEKASVVIKKRPFRFLPRRRRRRVLIKLTGL